MRGPPDSVAKEFSQGKTAMKTGFKLDWFSLAGKRDVGTLSYRRCNSVKEIKKGGLMENRPF
ncbi:hypothetical protein BRY73_09160 [Ochrobactrum sp. P6BS-III]|nr:hypothetical protein BRY73_09160 [Ochrobactrum sp. P6BS-III]